MLIICYRLMERLKSTLFCTVDCQHLKTRLLSTDNLHLYRRVQGRGEMMEHEFLEQFTSLTTTKLNANEYTELSPYLSCKMGNWECCFCSTFNAACRSQSSDNTKNDYKCICRIITLSVIKMIWERSFCIASNATCQKPIKR